jgi:hypothetical protein
MLDNCRKVGVPKLKINGHFGLFVGVVEVGEDVIAFSIVLSLVVFAGQRRYITRFHMFVRLVIHLYFMSRDLVHLPGPEEHEIKSFSRADGDCCLPYGCPTFVFLL